MPRWEFREHCGTFANRYIYLMVIAYFHRTLTILWFALITGFVLAFIAGAAYMTWDDWTAVIILLPALIWLVAVLNAIFRIAVVCKDPRAVWIENETLYFFESFFDDFIFVLVFQTAVPLGTITGLSSSRAKSAGGVKKPGIYIELKSGKSHKVFPFVLRESEDAVMARLREALTRQVGKS